MAHPVMMTPMKQRLIALAWSAAVLLASPASLLAQEDEVPDARLQGYPQSVTLEGGGTALSWLMLCILAALCIGVMFKNAKRTHLD
jgi:hypothetical protein